MKYRAHWSPDAVKTRDLATTVAYLHNLGPRRDQGNIGFAKVNLPSRVSFLVRLHL